MSGNRLAKMTIAFVVLCLTSVCVSGEASGQAWSWGIDRPILGLIFGLSLLAYYLRKKRAAVRVETKKRRDV